MQRCRDHARRLALTVVLLGLVSGCGPEAAEESPALELGAPSDQPAGNTNRAEPGMRASGRTPDRADVPPPTGSASEGAGSSEAGARSPENLAAAAIGALLEAFDALVAVLEPRPSAAVTRKAWEPIKERAESAMREIARHRRRLGREDRETLRRLVLERRPGALHAHVDTVHRAVERLHAEDLALARELAGAVDLVLIALRDPADADD